MPKLIDKCHTIISWIEISPQMSTILGDHARTNRMLTNVHIRESPVTRTVAVEHSDNVAMFTALESASRSRLLGYVAMATAAAAAAMGDAVVERDSSSTSSPSTINSNVGELSISTSVTRSPADIYTE